MAMFFKHFKYPIVMVFLTIGNYSFIDLVENEFGIFFQMAYFLIVMGCLGLQGCEIHWTYKENDLQAKKNMVDMEKLLADHDVYMKEEIRKMKLSQSRKETSLKRLN